MDLLDALNELRLLLNNSGVERTVGLRNRMGGNCAYYRKSLDLFLRNDYDRIKSILDKVNAEFEIINGPSEKK